MNTLKRKQVINIISKILNVKSKDLKDYHKVGDLAQWDSLAQINIFLKLKKKFKKKISLEKLSKIRSIKDWIQLFS